MTPAKSVVVIGASNQRQKYGNRAVRAYQRRGYVVYPVNPHEETIEGLPACRSILDVLGPVDRATLYVPPEVGVTLLGEIAQKGVGELFVNPGAVSDELLLLAETFGLHPIEACSILDIGEDPEKP
jgi:predicted CoA-binding protein